VIDLAVPLGIRKSFALQHGLTPTRCQSGDHSMETWRPWPAHAPFVDKVTRWWPSDEKPAITREPIYVYAADPRRSPELVHIPASGGMLNLTA